MDLPHSGAASAEARNLPEGGFLGVWGFKGFKGFRGLRG